MSSMDISDRPQDDTHVTELPEEFDGHFDWGHAADQTGMLRSVTFCCTYLIFCWEIFCLVDGSLINGIVPLDQEEADGGEELSPTEGTNIDDVTNLMLLPSLGQSEQNDMFENLFAISPLKTLTSNLSSPDRNVPDNATDTEDATPSGRRHKSIFYFKWVFSQLSAVIGPIYL